MYMYVYMYMYIYIYIHDHIYIYVYMYICVTVCYSVLQRVVASCPSVFSTTNTTTTHVYLNMCIYIYVYKCIHIHICIYIYVYMCCSVLQRVVDSCLLLFRLPYHYGVATISRLLKITAHRLFYRALLQKRPTIVRSLLIVATS